MDLEPERPKELLPDISTIKVQKVKHTKTSSIGSDGDLASQPDNVLQANVKTILNSTMCGQVGGGEDTPVMQEIAQFCKPHLPYNTAEVRNCPNLAHQPFEESLININITPGSVHTSQNP